MIRSPIGSPACWRVRSSSAVAHTLVAERRSRDLGGRLRQIDQRLPGMAQLCRLVRRVVERRILRFAQVAGRGVAVRHVSRQAFEDDGESLADADAQRGDAAPAAAALQLVRQPAEDAAARGAERVADARSRRRLGLTLSGSSSGHSPRQARHCDAKASLSSTTSMSSQRSPARASARSAAATGPMPKTSGSTPCDAARDDGASGSRPMASRRLRRRAAARGAVVERRRVARRHRAVRDERGLELREPLQRRCPGACSRRARGRRPAQGRPLVVDARRPTRRCALVAAQRERVLRPRA